MASEIKAGWRVWTAPTGGEGKVFRVEPKSDGMCLMTFVDDGYENYQAIRRVLAESRELHGTEEVLRAVWPNEPRLKFESSASYAWKRQAMVLTQPCVWTQAWWWNVNDTPDPDAAIAAIREALAKPAPCESDRCTKARVGIGPYCYDCARNVEAMVPKPTRTDEIRAFVALHPAASVREAGLGFDITVDGAVVQDTFWKPRNDESPAVGKSAAEIIARVQAALDALPKCKRGHCGDVATTTALDVPMCGSHAEEATEEAARPAPGPFGGGCVCLTECEVVADLRTQLADVTARLLEHEDEELDPVNGQPVSSRVGDGSAQELKELRAQVTRLEAQLNTPHIADFLEAVKLEALHQRGRWGTDHDAGKAPSDWFWLLGYLSGKALAAAIKGDRDKALHHTISSAAVMLNWHAHMTGDSTVMRPGIDTPQEAANLAHERKKVSDV